MTTITPHYRTVQQLLQNQSYAIDEYQREYTWEKRNVDELLTDLQAVFTRCYKPTDETTAVAGYEGYFLGSIIVTTRDNKTYLIDGQQRVTTLTLLLIWLYRAAEKTGAGVAKTIAPLIYSDNLGELRYNLDFPERLDVIDALFRGLSINLGDKDESNLGIAGRYGDIEQNDFIRDLNHSLPHFAYWLMTKVGLIEIATDNDDSAYAIFETMNDRGKPISPVDMLKGYLLASIGDPNQRQRANQEWRKRVFELNSWGGSYQEERAANCIKALLRAQYAESIRKREPNAKDEDWEQIGTQFHRWVRDNRERLGLGNAPGNLAIMTNGFSFYSRAYRRVLDASRRYSKGLEPVFYNAHNDFTWQNTVLLAPLEVSDDDEMVRRKIAVTATYLDIWLMRRAVNYIRVGYSSVSYAMFLLCKDIRRKSLDELVAILNKKLGEDDVTFEGSPVRGRRGISDLNLNQFTRRYIFHLLARLTAFAEVGAVGSDSFDKYVDRTGKNPYDIEHIWADKFDAMHDVFASESEFDQWRNHVASLLLLPADVNRSLQDKPYSEKVGKYADQNFYAKSLAPGAYENQPRFKAFREQHSLPFMPFATFGKAEQLERRKLIAAMVNIVWSPKRLEEAAA
jgi:uncharacterized protein with ParB-like and HNH nuclease domain